MQLIPGGMFSARFSKIFEILNPCPVFFLLFVLLNNTILTMPDMFCQLYKKSHTCNIHFHTSFNINFKTGKGNFSLSCSALNTELFFLYFETTKYSSSKFIFILSYNLVPTFSLFSMNVSPFCLYS